MIAGICLWLSFPSHDVWWIAPVGVALLGCAVTGVRARSGAFLGFLCGMAFFLPTLSWSGVYVGAFPWTALAVLQSLYLALTGFALALVSRHRPAILLGGATWVVGEWLRGTTPFGGFPWARLAFSQADAPWTPVVAYVGASGLTFLVAALGSALGAMVWALLVRDGTRPRAMRFVTAAVPVAALIAGTVVTPPTSGRMLKVAGIQGNVPTAGLEFNAQREAVLRNHVKGTRELADEVAAGKLARPDVVIWPENASDIDPLRNADAQRLIMDAVDDVKVPVIVGAVLSEPAPKVSNSALLYEPGKGITDNYVKQHPVPFGEYIPYRSFFRTFSTQVDLVRADFVQGKKVAVFSIPTAHGTAKVAPIICFEVAYDDLLRKPANRGAQMFAVQTNNATFGYTDESKQQIAISRIRALEYGRSIVHISTVGVSGLITPDGVVHDESKLFTHKVLTGKLPLRSEKTVAQHLGRIPEILSTVAVLGGFVVVAVRRTRRGARWETTQNS